MRSNPVPVSKSPALMTRCWLSFLLLSLAFPALIWSAVKLTSIYVPAAVHGSIEQRYLWSLAPGLTTEWMCVLALWLWLNSRGESFANMGFRSKGTWIAWTLALTVAALSIYSNTLTLQRMHFPLSTVLHPTGFHLYAALAMGLTAGFCEEVLFRAFLMPEFAKAGYGKIVQVVVPALAFGLSHVGYSSQGIRAVLWIMIPTTFVGMMWGVAYLLGKRSVLPSIVAHMLNDSIALPWIIFVIMTFRAH